MRVYTLSDRWSKKKLCVYTASEAKGLSGVLKKKLSFWNVQLRLLPCFILSRIETGSRDFIRYFVPTLNGHASRLAHE